MQPQGVGKQVGPDLGYKNLGNLVVSVTSNERSHLHSLTHCPAALDQSKRISPDYSLEKTPDKHMEAIMYFLLTGERRGQEVETVRGFPL
jgi:hypothetical protein